MTRNPSQNIGLNLLTIITTLTMAQASSAKGNYPQQLPNTTLCSRCHFNPGGGGARNLFGEDANDTKNGDVLNWAALCILDADDDGENNGTELGDPCCVWTMGDTPLTTTTSDPSDDQSTSGNICAPDAGPIDAGVDGGPIDAGVDGGPVDAGPVDGGPIDAGVVDAGIDAGDNPDGGVPGAWVCAADTYGDGQTCHCGCEFSDPDCASTALSACEEDNCGPGTIVDATDPRFCIDGVAPDAGPGGNAPDGWVCDEAWYGSDDGCDCGCGVADTDCASDAFDACATNSCPNANDGFVPDTNDPTQCIPAEDGEGGTCSHTGTNDGGPWSFAFGAALLLILRRRRPASGTKTYGARMKFFSAHNSPRNSFAALLLVAFALPSQAIIIRDDVDDTNYIVDDADYPALVDLIAPGDCIGTLVHESYLLSVAHCAVDLTVGASLSINGVAHVVDRVDLHPSWQDNDIFDVALVHLAQPVVGVVPYPLYRGTDELGKTITLVGRGVTANGLVGEPGATVDGNLRRATNIVTSVSAHVLEVTFESGAQQGVTPLEGVGAAGDSGGPVFLDVNGVAFIAGLNSYGDGPAEVGQYGASDFQARISQYLVWLDSIVDFPAPPTDGGVVDAGPVGDAGIGDAGSVDAGGDGGTADAGEDPIDDAGVVPLRDAGGENDAGVAPVDAGVAPTDGGDVDETTCSHTGTSNAGTGAAPWSFAFGVAFLLMLRRRRRQPS